MIYIYNYIVFRVFERFKVTDPEIARKQTISFMVVFQFSFLVPLYLISTQIFDYKLRDIFTEGTSLTYYLSLPLAIAMFYVNGRLLNKKLTGKEYNELHHKYFSDKYRLPMWCIFSLPILVGFVLPLLVGILTGSVRSPFLEHHGLLMTFLRYY